MTEYESKMLELAERRALAAELQAHCALEAVAEGKEAQMIAVMKRFNRRQDEAKDIRALAQRERRTAPCPMLGNGVI